MSFRKLRRAIVFCGLVASASAQAGPITLTYEGDLIANGGGPAQGEHALSFALYVTAAGGEAVWTEVHPDVLVVDGHFFVDLGTRVSLEGVGSADDVLFLGVSVDDDAEAEPRMTVGGALRAQWAALAENARDVRDADIQPRSVTLAGTPTRLENGSLRLGPEVNQVLTAPSLATLTGGGSADALHTHAGEAAQQSGVFLGLTVAEFDGNMGGRFGVNAKCSAEFPRSHQCSFCEIMDDELTERLARSAWVRRNPVCRTSGDPTGTCSGPPYLAEWMVNSAMVNGSSIDRDGTESFTPCNIQISIACCAN